MLRMSAVLEYPQKHPISAQEYLRMGEAGIFAPEVRLELIEGEIVEMAPIGSAHASTVALLNEVFVRQASGRALVWGQSPLILAQHSVPQPDLALLKTRPDRYFSGHPKPSDVLLLVEVSDTTVRFDLSKKIPLYARAGIVEAWVVDLEERAVRVFRDPDPHGYRTSFTASGDQKVDSSALPGVSVIASELFPK
jgi:Uma2 family endonuclease